MQKVTYRRSSKNNSLIKIAFKTFLNNFKMKKSQESAAETVTKRKRIILLVNQTCIIELELFHAVFEFFIVVRIHWIDRRIYNRLNFLKTRERLINTICNRSNCITYFYIAYSFKTRNNISYVTGFKNASLFIINLKNTALLYFIFTASAHHFNKVACFKTSFHNANMNNYTAVNIIMAVKNKGSKLSVWISSRSRKLSNNCFHELVYTFTSFCRNTHCLAGI